MHSHTTRISVQERLLSKRATRPFTHWGVVVTRRTPRENKKNRLSHEHSKYEKDGFSVIKLFDQKTVQRILFDSPSLLYHTFRQLSIGFEKLGGVEFSLSKEVRICRGSLRGFFLYIIYRDEISVWIDTERWEGFRRDGSKKFRESVVG